MYVQRPRQLADLQTSIMAVKFADGVVIGADSRTTTGAYIVSSGRGNRS